MTDQMQIFSRDGYLTDQPRTIFNRGLMLTTETSGQFPLSVRDTKCNPFTYNFGCPVLCRNAEGLPDFPGMIDGRKFDKGALIVTAYSPERWFLYRRGPSTLKLTGTAGDVFVQMIRYCEGLENTVLAVGDIDSKVHNCEEVLTPGATVASNLKHLVQTSGEGYRWRAEVVNGKLTIYGDWFSDMTLDTGLVLIDGFNISGNHTITETPPVNDVLTFGNGNDWAKRLTAIAKDEDSQHEYGLRQTTTSVSTDKQAVLDTAAQTNLAAGKQPKVNFPLSVLNTNGTYSKIAPGVMAEMVRLVGQGFSGNDLGYESTSLYIKGLNYNPADGYVGLAL